MFGQAHHFLDGTKEEVPYAIERYSNKCHGLYAVLNDGLGSKEYVAGSVYSVADIAIIPWVQRHARHRLKLEDFIC
ncbi:MAG: glutathione binding-like protein [Pseudomonadota bacterium]|nr:glutathione binding-like protein [Pseudomonadota bacterium]